jgi:D-methionine transport system permease protein
VFSDLLKQLVESGILFRAIWETIYLTLLSTLIAYLIGLPLGVILAVTAPAGVRPIPWLNRLLGVIVNIFRSIPFIVLMVAMLPVAKLIVGTSLGNAAMIVMLVIAAAPYIARMVESSIKEVNPGVIEAAQAMGTSHFRLITRVLLPEARPSLVVGAVISTVTVLGYSAMAATIGGGGLGAIAITWGYQRSKDDITWICVILIVIIVQVMQEVGMRIARKIDKRARQ